MSVRHTESWVSSFTFLRSTVKGPRGVVGTGTQGVVRTGDFRGPGPGCLVEGCSCRIVNEVLNPIFSLRSEWLGIYSEGVHSLLYQSRLDDDENVLFTSVNLFPDLAWDGLHKSISLPSTETTHPNTPFE